MTVTVPLVVEVVYAVVAGLALLLAEPRAMRRRRWKQPVALVVVLSMGVGIALGLAVPALLLIRIGVPDVLAALAPLVAWVGFCWYAGRRRDQPLVGT